MATNETRHAITQFINDYFLNRLPNMKLGDDDSLFEKGIIDSTGVLELVAFIEKQFNFRVEDDELIPANLDSINRITSYVNQKMGGAVKH